MKSATYSRFSVDNVSLLLGKELDFVEKGFIEIDQGKIRRAGAGKSRKSRAAMDGSGLLVIPGFINAHTHIADSIGKDIGLDAGLDERVHPVFGAKKKILEKSRPEHLSAFIRNSAISMMTKGITAFADFREGGTDGVELLKKSIAGLPIKGIILGRVDQYFPDPGSGDKIAPEKISEAAQIMENAGGLGISGANENTDSSLGQYHGLKKGDRLLAIHAAESKNTAEFSLAKTRRTEVARIMQHLKPDLLIHMTHASDGDIESVSGSGAGIVVCPRANGVLGAGIPRVARMLEKKCRVAIGTDNVMLNSPDMFREMDYIWKASRAAEGTFLDPKELVKMATVNAAEMLHLNSGCIEQGRAADLLFIDKNHIDMYPMHNPYAAIVHRASAETIKAVMIGGRFVSSTGLVK